MDDSDIPDKLAPVSDMSDSLRDVSVQPSRDIPWQDMNDSGVSWPSIIAYTLIGLCFVFLCLILAFLQRDRIMKCCNSNREPDTVNKDVEPTDINKHNSEIHAPLHDEDCDIGG